MCTLFLDVFYILILSSNQVPASNKIETRLMLPHLTDLLFKFFNFGCRSREGWRVAGLVWRSYHFVFLAPAGTSGNILGMVWTLDTGLKNTHNVKSWAGLQRLTSKYNISSQQTRRKISWGSAPPKLWETIAEKVYWVSESQAQVFSVSCFVQARGVICHSRMSW